MKVTVDENCGGSGLCVDICPAVFELGPDGLSKVKVDVVPAEEEDAVREAEQSCPFDAIHITE